jgi:hypothetical protein
VGADVDPDEDGLQAAFQQLQQGGRVGEADLLALAVQFRVTCGKWMIFAGTAAVDALWALVARAVVGGLLGPIAKVAPRCTTGAYSRHLICVYVDDFDDQGDLQRVHDGLRSLGIRAPLMFKPDAYTLVGVYQGNPWGIPPVMHRSTLRRPFVARASPAPAAGTDGRGGSA